MLIRPRGISACRMNDAEDTVGADKIPRKNWIATIVGIANQSLRIDRIQTAIGQGRTRRPAVQLRLINVDPFFILSRRSRGLRVRSARTSRKAVTRRLRRSVEIP